jgi:glycosyltransferase involved in cell wall biosynthesis
VSKSIALLHPFSAKAIGLSETDLLVSHSKSHEKALLQLQKDGYKVAMAYFTGRLFPFSKNPNGVAKRFWPITKPLFQNRHRWRGQHSFFHYWRTYFRPPDVTIINMSGHGSAYCFKLAKLLRKKRKPYIAMLGGIHLSKSGAARVYYQNAHHLIVHTQIQKQQLLQMEAFENLSIQVMPLGVDTERFYPIPKTFDAIKLLYVGRTSQLKQIELAIETLALLKESLDKDVTLTIVGPESDPAYLAELKALAVRLQVSNKILFEGVVAQSQLVAYYQKANLLMLPSAHESFGMVMVEAMACGTPVAALKNSGGPDEIIENGVNGILATKETYSKSILKYFQNNDINELLSKNARTIATEKWSTTQTENALRNSLNMIFTN